MGLELLTQADYVLNSCGRPVPPKGFKFVDLPRIIPFHATAPQYASAIYFLTGGEGSTIIPSKILITAVNPGAAGNNIQVNLGTTGALPPHQAESVSVVVAGAITTITYNPPTDSAGNLIYTPPTVGTNLQLLDAISNSVAASALITATLYSGPITGQGYPHFPPIAGSFFLMGGSDGYPTNAVLPFQNFVENNSNTLFLCRGISISSDPVQIRIKWPNGRYWNQQPSGNPFLSAGACFPQGTGGNLFALDEEVAIPAGGKVTVELSGTQGGPIDVYLWGVLRYLLKDTAGGPQVDGKTCIVGYPAQAQSQGPPSCLVGYPVSTPGSGGLKMMNDPVQVLKMRPRFSCWPNGNIFAPEFRLGNQCETDTPPGYEDESFTFFSGIPAGTPYIIPAGGQSYSNPVGIPGQEDLIIRRWRAITAWNAGPIGPPAFGTPVVQIRLPNGYSVTGGDQIPINLGYWYPVFPTLRVVAGTVMILDISDSQEQVGNPGNIGIVFEFDAVKRRKIPA